jgi:hypothetical protein
MFEDKETCCFMHLIYRMITDKSYYLLSVKDYEKTQAGKTLLGYYDDDYVYLVPDVVIGYGNILLNVSGLRKFNMKKILHNLFAANLIKVHWILTCDIRYRPQKRVGKTKKRYITFFKRPLAELIITEGIR